jgi:hypothetical protein
VKLPEPFWAVVLAALGVGLEMAILFVPGASDAVRHDVATAAFGLITGAVGAFSGRAGSATTTTTTTSPTGEVISKAGNAQE